MPVSPARYLLLAVAICLVPTLLAAQDPELAARYRVGGQLYSAAKYHEAAEVFRGVATQSNDQQLVMLATYFESESLIAAGEVEKGASLLNNWLLKHSSMFVDPSPPTPPSSKSGNTRGANSTALSASIVERAEMRWIRLQSTSFTPEHRTAILKRIVQSDRAETLRYQAAIELGNQYLRTKPAATDSLQLAVESFTKAAELTKNPAEVSLAKYQIAVAQQKQHEPQRATELFRAIMQEYPAEPAAKWAQTQLGIIAHHKSEWQEVVRNLESIKNDKAIGSLQPQAMYFCAVAHQRLGQHNEAVTGYQNLVARFPESEYWGNAVLALAQCHLAMNDLPAAREALQRYDEGSIESAHTLDAFALPLHATVLKLERSQTESSSAESPKTTPEADSISYEAKWSALLERTQKYPPTEWKASIWKDRLELLVADRQWEKAHEFALQCIDHFRGQESQSPFEFLQGRIWFTQAELDKAKLAFQKIADDPSAPAALRAQSRWMAGETLLHQKKLGEAIATFAQVVDQHDVPRWKVAALLQAGKCYELNSENDRALELYREATKYEVDDVFMKNVNQRIVELTKAKTTKIQ